MSLDPSQLFQSRNAWNPFSPQSGQFQPTGIYDLPPWLSGGPGMTLATGNQSALYQFLPFLLSAMMGSQGGLFPVGNAFASQPNASPAATMPGGPVSIGSVLADNRAPGAQPQAPQTQPTPTPGSPTPGSPQNPWLGPGQPGSIPSIFG
jgi:hypothetical protein